VDSSSMSSLSFDAADYYLVHCGSTACHTTMVPLRSFFSI